MRCREGPCFSALNVEWFEHVVMQCHPHIYEPMVTHSNLYPSVKKEKVLCKRREHSSRILTSHGGCTGLGCTITTTAKSICSNYTKVQKYKRSFFGNLDRRPSRTFWETVDCKAFHPSSRLDQSSWVKSSWAKCLRHPLFYVPIVIDGVQNFQTTLKELNFESVGYL